MSKEREVWRVEVAVALEVPKEDVEDVISLASALEGEIVKVKSGQYENVAVGEITKVLKISGKTS